MARDPKQDNPSFSSVEAIAATKLQRLGTGVWKIPKGPAPGPCLLSGQASARDRVPVPKHGNTSLVPQSASHHLLWDRPAACLYLRELLFAGGGVHGGKRGSFQGAAALAASAGPSG